jgi:hypothetical protein
MVSHSRQPQRWQRSKGNIVVAFGREGEQSLAAGEK